MSQAVKEVQDKLDEAFALAEKYGVGIEYNRQEAKKEVENSTFPAFDLKLNKINVYSQGERAWEEDKVDGFLDSDMQHP